MVIIRVYQVIFTLVAIYITIVIGTGIKLHSKGLNMQVGLLSVFLPIMYIRRTAISVIKKGKISVRSIGFYIESYPVVIGALAEYMVNETEIFEREKKKEKKKRTRANGQLTALYNITPKSFDTISVIKKMINRMADNNDVWSRTGLT